MIDYELHRLRLKLLKGGGSGGGTMMDPLLGLNLAPKCV